MKPNERVVLSPHDVHEAARTARSNFTAKLAARASGLANARLIVFGGGVAWLIARVFAHLPPFAWLGGFALVFVFVVLVVVHARVLDAKERALAALRFHERALARMTGAWRAFPSTGERFVSATHAYSSDLDVFGKASLFQRLDGTLTAFGEEVLAGWLSNQTSPSESSFSTRLAHRRARQTAVRDLAPRVALREAFAVAGVTFEAQKPDKLDPRAFAAWAGEAPVDLSALSAERAQTASLTSALTAAVVMPLLNVGTALATAFFGWPRSTFLVPFVLSVVLLTRVLRPRLAASLNAASSKEHALSHYANVFEILESATFESEALKAIQMQLRESGASATSEMKALSRITGFLDARNNEIFRLFLGPVLMWDVWCALALERWRQRAGRAAMSWFRALAEFEALASLAGFAFENPDYAFPSFVENATFEATALGHPLLQKDKRVDNAITLPGPGHALVVTGSNMSGKSTFLRAIGLNVVLANAGAPVCAASLTLGSLTVATSMRVADSLDEGTSRFYAELKKLKLVLGLAAAPTSLTPPGSTLLFLLDEILHGTNTRERLIGARAFVRALLARGAMGAVSTHDLALGDLASDSDGKVRNVHFEEQVEGDVMTFDYTLREGVVQSSNALRLMRIVGLEIGNDEGATDA